MPIIILFIVTVVFTNEGTFKAKSSAIQKQVKMNDRAWTKSFKLLIQTPDKNIINFKV